MKGAPLVSQSTPVPGTAGCPSYSRAWYYQCTRPAREYEGLVSKRLMGKNDEFYIINLFDTSPSYSRAGRCTGNTRPVNMTGIRHYRAPEWTGRPEQLPSPEGFRWSTDVVRLAAHIYTLRLLFAFCGLRHLHFFCSLNSCY